MIDLHCHLLPGIDDGSKSLEMSLEMARMACADGIGMMVCTPHIMPGVYDNQGEGIREGVRKLRQALQQAEIPLRVAAGADVHIAPDLVQQFQDGRALTLNQSRYLLLEPPHHVLPPRLEDHVFGLHTAGYVAILTHPERLSWIDRDYSMVEKLFSQGVLMQITAGSLAGRFGRRPRYWAERMLDEGMCHLLATDAHDPERRPPRLAEGRDLAAKRVGDDEAMNLVMVRPRAILENRAPTELPPVVRKQPSAPPSWMDLLPWKKAKVGL